jgi:hypothetical protein
MESSSLSFRVAETQLSCKLSGEAVILNLSDGNYYGLNEVGTRIWELLQENRSLGQIEIALIDEYDVAQDECRRETEELVRQFLAKGLLRIAGDTQ